MSPAPLRAHLPARAVAASLLATALLAADATAQPIVRTVTFTDVCSSGAMVACASVSVTTFNGIDVNVYNSETGNYDPQVGTGILFRTQNLQGWRAGEDNTIWTRLRNFRMTLGDGGDIGGFGGFGIPNHQFVETEGDVPAYNALAFNGPGSWAGGAPYFGIGNGSAYNASGIIESWANTIDLYDFFGGEPGPNTYHSDVAGCALPPGAGLYTAALQTCRRDAQDVFDGYATEVNDPWVTFAWGMGGRFNADDANVSYSWSILGLPGITLATDAFGALAAGTEDGPIPGFEATFQLVHASAEPGPDDELSALGIPPAWQLNSSVNPVDNVNGFASPLAPTAVPEPSAIALLGGGLLLVGLGSARRRRA